MVILCFDSLTIRLESEDLSTPYPKTWKTQNTGLAYIKKKKEKEERRREKRRERQTYKILEKIIKNQKRKTHRDIKSSKKERKMKERQEKERKKMKERQEKERKKEKQ